MSETTQVPVVVWSGVFTLFGVPLHAHVLNDGRRVIDVEDMDALFAAMRDGRVEFNSVALSQLGGWIRGEGDGTCLTTRPTP